MILSTLETAIEVAVALGEPLLLWHNTVWSVQVLHDVTTVVILVGVSCVAYKRKCARRDDDRNDNVRKRIVVSETLLTTEASAEQHDTENPLYTPS